MTALFCDSALTHLGWARNVRIDIVGDGTISGLHVGAAAGSLPRAKGPVIPGMANLHSHAFQRAMAGLTERSSGREDSFWTWREVMYDFVAKLGPDEVEAIAAQLYVEMLKAGYTAVAEFHYLHHLPDGRPYDDPTAASAAQARFLNDPDRHAMIVGRLIERHADEPDVRIGYAAHSLRAVTPETLAELIALREVWDREAPIHIHIAEQEKEVEDCLAWSGARPVDWLLHNAPVDARWCLVHATHLDEGEIAALAATGAVAGLCPTTEANLGDGIFPAQAYANAGGRFGIGSDSHVSVSPVEELRLLEYGQRLSARRRTLLTREGSDSVGLALYQGAAQGGAQATGFDTGQLAPGARADLVVLDGEHAQLVGREGDALLDSHIFSGNRSVVRDVMVGGRWVIEDGHHADEGAIAAEYAAAVQRLMA
jgi:formimidoylglutamate deiminase